MQSSSSSSRQRAMGEREPEVEVEQEPLPSKLANTNTVRSVPSQESQVLVNFYQMDVSKAEERIYKYELKFMKRVEKQIRDGTSSVEDKDLSRGPRGDVAMQQKRRCLYQCYLLMLRGNEEVFGSKPRKYCYDCGINFYSIRELDLPPDEKGQRKREFPIDPGHLPEEQRAYLGKLEAVKALWAQLTAVQTIFPRNRDPEDHSVSQFLDILSNQEITLKDNYLFFPSKIFERDSVIGLDRDPRILKDGMQKNVRYVGDDEQSAVPVMQIDPKKSAFFDATTVVDFLDAFLPGRGRLNERIQNNLRLANKQLKRLVVMTTHLDNNRTFELFGLSQGTPRDMYFEMRDGERTSVERYFQTRYTITLHHPTLPCAIEKNKGGGQDQLGESYYPLEVLKILPGQRVSIDKQTPQLTEQMIRKCQALPAEFKQLNENAKSNAIIVNSNPYLKSHNVRVASELTSADASVLFPPAIHYADARDRDESNENGVMDWRLRGRRYLDPAQPPPRWVALIFGGEVPGDSCKKFLDAIVQSARSRGIQLGLPTVYDDVPDKTYATVRERFGYYYENGVKFVMFFTGDKLDPVHHTVKQMEIDFNGMITQHISRQTMEKAIGPKGAQMVIDNILLKFNLKLGGVNFGLSTSGAFAQLQRSSTGRGDIVKDQWLQPGRMFIGLDMSHASPQSLFDRQSGVEVSEPTVVGCAYTLGQHVLKMRGTYWYQESRLTHIHREVLAEKVKVALKNYKEQSGDFPHHVFVFRGGVSEGEYQAVLVNEKEAFKMAFAELGLNKRQLTIVVVQRQSNYRIVPTRIVGMKPHEQNVRPGTCVDRKVMHPSVTEFLLVGHKAIQGTARPVRCTVVYDTEPRVPLEEVENLSYALCYAHGIVLSPVSVPAPLYSAADLAKRGRNNWKVRKEEDEDRGSQSSGRFQLQQDQDAHNFFLGMSGRMEPTSPTKFWA